MKTTAHWLDVLPEDMSLDILRDLAYSHALEAGPYAKALLGLIHRADFKGLCGFEIDYSLEALTAHEVIHARQALAFFTKLRHLDIGVDKREVGMSTFLEAEELCRNTNARFRMRRAGELAFPARVDEVFRLAQRKIRNVLKGSPPAIADLTLRFGPGSTRQTRKADASIRSKSSEGINCSEELFPMVGTLLRELPALTIENSELSWTDDVDGDWWDLVSIRILASKLSFAVKNAKTMRLIGIEPLLNLMYQLGIGEVMAKRLAAFGVDIRRQEPNQLAAQQGSLTGALATLDLKSASDTVSKELVYELLPLEWARALARGRSGWIELPNGTLVNQEKFSAMGNGFTFPLETLIFWALASSACNGDDDVLCYGDDLVVKSEHFDFVSECLRYAGFNVNLEKSYKNGPFRESCGKDFFHGIDVRPFYQKEWLSAQSLFVLHNWYVRHGDFVRAQKVVNYIHPALVIYGPDGYGDGHLIGDFPRRLTPEQERNGYGGFFFESYTTKSRREVRKDLQGANCGDYPASLYSIYQRSSTVTDVLVKGTFRDPDGFYDALDALIVPDRLEQMFPAGVPIPVDRETGLKSWVLPGSDGYKKIKIYTF